MARRRSDRRAATWLERGFALFLVLHGLAHTVGTSAFLKDADEGRTVEHLGGLWSVSSPTLLRALGVAWALAALGYFVVAAAYWIGASRRRTLLVAVTIPSLVLSVIAVWASVIGVVIDVLLLTVAWWTRGPRVEPLPLRPETTAPRRAA